MQLLIKKDKKVFSESSTVKRSVTIADVFQQLRVFEYSGGSDSPFSPDNSDVHGRRQWGQRDLDLLHCVRECSGGI